MAGLKNNYQFEFTDTLTTSGMSVRISNEKENGAVATFTDQYVTARSEDNSIVERMKGSASAGVLTLSMRGLDQTDTDTQVPGLKRERREGTKVFVTYVASQHVDAKGNNTFSGTQTFENITVSNNSALTNATVSGKYKGPVVADVIARDALYPTPVGGNEVFVQSLNAKQVYNAGTSQRETQAVGTPAPDATDVIKGIQRNATTAEVVAGTLNNVTVTPQTLSAVTPEALVDRDTYILGEDCLVNDSLFPETEPTFNDVIAPITDLNNLTYSGAGLFIGQSGLRFQARGNIIINSVNKDAGCGATRAILKTDIGNTTIATATFIGNIATFSGNFEFSTNAFFRIELDNNGVSFANSNNVSPGFPITRTNVIYDNGSTSGGNNPAAYNITAITTQNRDTALVQNIGDVTVNTKVALYAFGSGVSGSTMKLALRKFVSPSADLAIRLETVDGSGNPTGTLVNANATATVTAASLTTSLVDTTITFAGSFTISKGQKCAIILSQVGNVVNATNYYGVGYITRDTTIRHAKTWNGTIWSSGQTNRFYYTSSTLYISTLLSKTDADFAYKLPTDFPRFAVESKSAGQNVITSYLGLKGGFTGLSNTTYYASNTPGLISATAGTNPYIVGNGIDTTTLKIDGKNLNKDITVSASPFSYTNTTGGPIQVKITGGTVNPIVINGVTTATATGHINTLPAGGVMTVTYTVLPTITYSDL